MVCGMLCDAEVACLECNKDDRQTDVHSPPLEITCSLVAWHPGIVTREGSIDHAPVIVRGSSIIERYAYSCVAGGGGDYVCTACSAGSFSTVSGERMLYQISVVECQGNISNL